MASPFSSTTGMPTMAHWECALPEAKPHLPVTVWPPSA